jgi:hypothetical protein
MLRSLVELSGELRPLVHVNPVRSLPAGPCPIRTKAPEGMELSPYYYVVFRVQPEEDPMNSIIYIVGLIVVIGVVLSFFGLR